LSVLSVADFAYNNHVHISIGHFPYVAKYSFDLQTPSNLIDIPIDRIQQQDNDGVLHRHMTVYNLVVVQLKMA
jgi:hypothetical protein